MITPESVKANQARMETLRANHDSKWSEIARLVYPEMNRFYGGTMAGWAQMGGRVDAEMHNPYAAQAFEDGVSLFEGFVMPRGQRWQKLALDAELMKSVRVQQWVEKKELRLFQLRNDPESGFVGAVHESAMSLYAFAAQSMWIDIRRSPVTGRKVGLSYESEFVGEQFVEWDASGTPFRLHRKFALTAEQAFLKWGRNTPAPVMKAMGQDKNKDGEFEFIHVIEPNTQYDPERIDHHGKPWAAAYYLCGGNHEIFLRGGYHSKPRIFSTFTRGLRNSWGFSPTMRILPQIRLLQEITQHRVFGAELRLLPPFLATDDELDGAILEMRALGVTFGGLDDRGNPKMKTFFDASDSRDAELLAQEACAIIDKGYGRDLLQITREQKTHITATRTEEEKVEKGVLLAPLARQEAEWLAPMTVRELALMGEMGDFDDAPGEVIEYFEAEGEFSWRYDNELTRMMQAQDTTAYLSLAQQVGLLAQFDNTVVEDFRREYPMAKVLDVLGQNAGVPAAMRATEEEKQAYDTRKAQEAQQQALLAALPAVSDTIKNVSGVASNGA
ncbi:portal protein [Novosphingobium sp. ST904]|nr:portal protein [Novosphingobium sp. ST904]